MKINLNGLTVSGFQNIAENQALTFDGPGMYALIGKNLDDGGSNGSGKSSFTRALTAGILGTKYIDITNKEIKNRILGVPARITIDLEANYQPVQIDRTIGGKLNIAVDGVELDGKADEIQDKFIKHLGISAEHFIHLTHKMQGQFGGFLLMKDSEKKDFLGSFFDTSKLEAAASQNQSIVNQLNKDMIQASEQLKATASSLTSLNQDVLLLTEKVTKYTSTEFISTLASKKSELTHKEMELHQIQDLDLESMLNENEEYLSLKKQYTESVALVSQNETILSQEMATISSDIAGLQNKINSPVSVPAELLTKVFEIEQQVKAVRLQQQTLNSLLSEKNQLSKTFDTVHKKALSLKPDICHTCGQSITDEMYQKISETIGTELRQASDLLEANRKRLESVLSEKLDDEAIQNAHAAALGEITSFKLSQDKSNLKTALANLEESLRLKKLAISEMSRFTKNLETTINHFKETTKSNYQLLLGKVRAEIDSIKKDISAMERESSDAQTTLTAVMKKYNDCMASTTAVETRISSISKELNVRNHIGNILSINGFVGYIFDTVLEEINQEVNENIKQIPVISRLSMYFTPDKTAKTTGNTTKSITSKLFDRGDEISFETLSGSEKQSLLLAVDVAVDIVLCRRLGVDINYKIFDEQFGWVDENNKEPLLEFIKQKYYDKIVLIVDHGSELNAAIDRKIVITKQDGIATVVCQGL